MLDPKEEQRYQQLRELGQELQIPMLQAFIELEVRDKDGKLLQRQRQRSHSWVRNAYNFLFANLAGKDLDDNTFGAGLLSLKDTAGAIKWGDSAAIWRPDSMPVDGTNYGYRAPAGQDLWGILVGSGGNAESFEAYVLQTQIADGTGAGELAHIESEEHSISYSDTTLENELVRYFNNNSGGNVDVNEVALSTRGRAPGSAVLTYYVMSRDKLGATVTVPDTGQLKVTYTVSLVYPE